MEFLSCGWVYLLWEAQREVRGTSLTDPRFSEFSCLRPSQPHRRLLWKVKVELVIMLKK